LNSAGDTSLPEDGDLAGVAVRLQIAPRECAQFADPDGRSVEQRQDRSVPPIGLEADDPVQVRFRENSFVQSVAHRWKSQRPAHIEWEVAQPMSERQKWFNGGKRAIPARWRALFYRLSEFLEIGKCDGAERLPCPGLKSFDIGPVSSLGVWRPLVQPKSDELIVSAHPGQIGFVLHFEEQDITKEW
jgi:hypothetical protein